MFSRQDALNRHLRVEGGKAPCCGLNSKKSSEKLYDESPSSTQMSASPALQLENTYMNFDPYLNFYPDQPMMISKDSIESLRVENNVLRQQLVELQQSSHAKIEQLHLQIKELEIERSILHSMIKK
jgi:hypothetical protein